MYKGNIVTAAGTLLTWPIVLLLIVMITRKQKDNAKPWKIVVAYFIGLFSFSITFSYFDQPVKIAILPLGVWILYALLIRRNSWAKYRTYAWIGFASNFIFLLFSLLSIPIHHLIFPQDSINTYISDLSEAHIIATHPSADSNAMLQHDALQYIQLAKETQIESDQWYYETSNDENEEKNEKFPYMLLEADAKWGSSFNPIIYIEQDGKGILITTEKKQFYFRTSQAIISGVTQHE